MPSNNKMFVLIRPIYGVSLASPLLTAVYIVLRVAANGRGDSIVTNNAAIAPKCLATVEEYEGGYSDNVVSSDELAVLYLICINTNYVYHVAQRQGDAL